MIRPHNKTLLLEGFIDKNKFSTKLMNVSLEIDKGWLRSLGVF